MLNIKIIYKLQYINIHRYDQIHHTCYYINCNRESRQDDLTTKKL